MGAGEWIALAGTALLLLSATGAATWTIASKRNGSSPAPATVSNPFDMTEPTQVRALRLLEESEKFHWPRVIATLEKHTAAIESLTVSVRLLREDLAQHRRSHESRGDSGG